MYVGSFFFFFQAEDGIRDKLVTGVQTCALPISRQGHAGAFPVGDARPRRSSRRRASPTGYAPAWPWRAIRPSAQRSAPPRGSARAIRRGTSGRPWPSLSKLVRRPPPSQDAPQVAGDVEREPDLAALGSHAGLDAEDAEPLEGQPEREIGRASCRERV